MRRLLVVTALVLGLPCAAHAGTSAAIRALALRAQSDPAALARLRAVREVDGKPVDFASLLAGPGLRARLRTLAAGALPAQRLAEPAGAAREILRERRFHESTVPRPFHGILAWLGARFAFVVRAWQWLAQRLPGGGHVLWAVLGGLVLAAAAWIGSRLARRSDGRLAADAQPRRPGPAGDPAALEREANRAERDGDFETALRLRFRAGLIQLGRARALPLRPSLTSGEASSILHLAEFDALAHSFDEVVYGRRPAEPRDVEAAREGWPHVLESARLR
jgi:hypothetical protein